MSAWTSRAIGMLERRWKLVVLLLWLTFCAALLFSYRADILLFNLFDTDDNMRLMQVRGLLDGQGWYDLRQYRLNPPAGANIHWSRLVDLPIAGLILAFGSVLDATHAERAAVGVAPLLPLLVAAFGLSLTARRLLSPAAYPLLFASLFYALSALGMFAPERIDHHGWQLAMLALSISAVADPKRTRGGLTLGITTALSLAIGLEMIIYLALLGVALVLFWVDDDSEERERLRAYALSLAATTAIAFVLFVSYDNRSAVCDALSPVWLSDALLGGALIFLLARLSPRDRRSRLLVAVAAGGALGLFHGLAWPQCLHRFDAVTPDAERLWLSNVREVWPVYHEDWRIAVLLVAIPITGLVGWTLLAWLHRDDRDLFRRTVSAAACAVAASLLLLWQMRAAPAAQMLATVGCAALIWHFVPIAWRWKSHVLALGGVALIAIIGAGAAAPILISFLPSPTPGAHDLAIMRAASSCPSMWAMEELNDQPKGLVMTFIDLGPRLITLTHHDAIAGPYHRNSQQIVDVMNFWRGSPEDAHAILAKYRASYVLSCPDMPTTTTFDAPHDFYQQLEAGEVPKWLAPVTLSAGSPYKMWKVAG